VSAEREVPGGGARQPGTTQVVLNAEELALLRSALRYLESTLGREEASELEEVQALAGKLELAEREARRA
jgi:hypothetical protein